MVKARLTAVLAIGVAIACESHGPCKEPPSTEMSLATERVIVFKDGYCLVVKEGMATTDQQGMVYTEDVPDAAILGSFWAIPETGSLRSMVAGWHQREERQQRTVNCSNVAEVLFANRGKQCTLRLGHDQTLRGTIRKLLMDGEPAGLPDAAASIDEISGTAYEGLTGSLFDGASAAVIRSSGGFLDPISSGGIEGPRQSDLSESERASQGNLAGQARYFLLETNDGTILVDIHEVRNLTIEDMRSTIPKVSTRQVRRKRLSMRFEQIESEVHVKLIYFRPDVRWIPTYRVNLTDAKYTDGDEVAMPNESDWSGDPKVAELAMQCALVNEAEDFEDVPFHVVVGVPNFRFRDIPSPMVLEKSVRSVLAQTSPQIMMRNGAMSNAMFSQQSNVDSRPIGSRSEASSSIELPDATSAEAGNDLYVYELERLTLMKGERATIPLQRGRVPYRDIYTWKAQVTHSPTYAASSDDAPSPLVLAENDIWRNIELLNVTDLPWTTGAIMLNDGFQPLAQELLTYTSAGNICRIPVTIAIDVQGKLRDREVDRELQALQWRGHGYARVEGEIDVEVISRKAEPIPLEIDLRFGGKAVSVSDEGLISRSAYRREDWGDASGDAINPSSQIEWRATVASEEPFRPTVDYHYWVRY